MSRPSKNKKRLVHIRDKNICQYCFKKMNELEKTVDHVVPSHKGGSNEIENLVSCCKECNQKKDIRERSIILC